MTTRTLKPGVVARRLLLLNLVRRLLQLSVLALFIGTARLGWTLLGEPLVSGDPVSYTHLTLPTKLEV